jgi:hypothetical protein
MWLEPSGSHRQPSALHQARQRTRVFAQRDQRATGPARLAQPAHVKKRAEAKIEDIEDRIKTLQRMKRALRKLSDACGGKGSVSECPILDALDEGKKR